MSDLVERDGDRDMTREGWKFRGVTRGRGYKIEK